MPHTTYKNLEVDLNGLTFCFDGIYHHEVDPQSPAEFEIISPITVKGLDLPSGCVDELLESMRGKLEIRYIPKSIAQERGKPFIEWENGYEQLINKSFLLADLAHKSANGG